MHKLGTSLITLVAIMLIGPTAHAFGCDDTDDIADCVQSIVKAPPVRQLLPTATKAPTMLTGECDPDDEDNVKACLRKLKAPDVGQFTKSHPRTAAAAPAEKQPVENSEEAPGSATVALRPTHTPELAAHVERDTARPGCQKYFSAVGKLVEVPCGE
jgi:hypothetical protein